MIKLAIFDLDGTLVDSMHYWSIAPLDYIKEKNIDITIDQELSDKFLSMSLVESAIYFKENYGITDPIDEICLDIDKKMEYYYLNYVELKPGILDLIKKLDNLGIKMAIATATDHFLVDEVLDKLNINKYFTYTLTSTEVGSSKQKPDIYLKIAEHFNATPEESMIFEDLPYGIISGNGAGFHTVGVYDKPSVHHQKTIKKNAKLYVKHINNISIYRIISYIKNSK